LYGGAMPVNKDTVLKLVALDEIKAWDRNPRLNEEAVEPVARSIMAHGYRDLMEVNEKMELLAGHTRLKALLKIREHGGLEAIKGAITKIGQVMVLVHKGIKNEDAYRLANNKTGEFAEWDMPNLKDLLGELDIGEFGLDMTGFTSFELKHIEQSEHSYRPGMKNPVLTEEEKDNISTDDAPDGFFDDVKQFYVMFSGGRDSLAAIVLLQKQFPDIPIKCFFSDTGVEFPGIVAEVAHMCEFLKVGLVIVKPDIEWWSWIRKKGWPSILYRSCQREFIYGPIEKQIEKLSTDKTILVTGGRKIQGNRGSKKEKYGWNPATKLKHYLPVFYCSNGSVEKINANHPHWTGYDKGFVRSACWCCPGQNRKQARALQKNFPGLAQTIREWEIKLGQKLEWTKKKGCLKGTSFDDLLGSNMDDTDFVIL